MHCSGLAWNSRLSGIQISKLNRRSGPGEGQPDNRKLNEPSAMRQIQFNYIYRVCPSRIHIANKTGIERPGRAVNFLCWRS